MCIVLLIGVPDSPILSYETILNQILITLLPVISDTVCGPVTYNVTVTPSHGMVVRMNDTFYNITGLNNNTDYTVTVYASNSFSNGQPTLVTVKTKPLPPGTLLVLTYIHTYIRKYVLMRC